MSTAPLAPHCHVVELRQYTLHPGQRDVLIGLFDREFVETQEAVGMRVLGQFRDVDAADRFVWLRGFADMPSRQRGLTEFYGGPGWAAHRDVANATMVDFDDVQLLRPAWPGAANAMTSGVRAAREASRVPPGLVDATIFPLRQAPDAGLLAFCRRTMTEVLVHGGAAMLGWYITEPSANNFPRLPVREGEHVLVGLALFRDAAAFDSFRKSGTWQRDVAPTLSAWLAGAPTSLRLAPTARSAIHA